MADDTIINAPDLHTEAKASFLTTMEKQILEPRNLNYKVMCCGPTGTNAIEASLMLARKNKNVPMYLRFQGHSMECRSGV